MTDPVVERLAPAHGSQAVLLGCNHHRDLHDVQLPRCSSQAKLGGLLLPRIIPIPKGTCAMSITIKRTGEDILILEGAQSLPEGTPVQLFTEDELRSLELNRRAMLDLQMPSFIRGDEGEEAGDLFFL